MRAIECKCFNFKIINETTGKMKEREIVAFTWSSPN